MSISDYGEDLTKPLLRKHESLRSECLRNSEEFMSCVLMACFSLAVDVSFVIIPARLTSTTLLLNGAPLCSRHCCCSFPLDCSRPPTAQPQQLMKGRIPWGTGNFIRGSSMARV
jgi:hypothetical protein